MGHERLRERQLELRPGCHRRRREPRLRSQSRRAEGDDAVANSCELSVLYIRGRSDADLQALVRLKADGNHWSNDSVWVQFGGAADAAATRPSAPARHLAPP